jgi:hypothetical protein
VASAKAPKWGGAMASGAGRLGSQGLEGRCNAAPSHACLRLILAHTPEPLCVIHEGARSHPSASPQALLAAPSDRLTAEPLPSESPDAHPLADLWKKTKQRATPHTSGKECAALTIAVEQALAYCATHPEEVLGLLGRSCAESGFELKQAAEISKSKPEHL